MKYLGNDFDIVGKFSCQVTLIIVVSEVALCASVRAGATQCVTFEAAVSLKPLWLCDIVCPLHVVRLNAHPRALSC